MTPGRPTRRALLVAAAAAAAGAPPALATPRRAPAADPPRPARPPPFVMLDPGHGGKDPGAIGITGTYEKHVAFAAATELKRQLDASGRYRVELTRQRDVFIPLEERVGIAQHKGAGAVRLHARGRHCGPAAVRGASIYTLSDTASDAQTAALARRENAADRFAGPAFQNVPPDVARHPGQPGAAGNPLRARPGCSAGSPVRSISHYRCCKIPRGMLASSC